MQAVNATVTEFKPLNDAKFESGLEGFAGGVQVLQAGVISKQMVTRFDIKQAVFFAVFDWEKLIQQNKSG